MELDDANEAMEIELDEVNGMMQIVMDDVDVAVDGDLDGDNADDRKMVWNKDIEEEIKMYLQHGRYPDRCKKKKEEKRIFRRRAQRFVVNNGQVYYQRKTSGRSSLLVTLTSKEEQKRAFQVCTVKRSLMYTSIST